MSLNNPFRSRTNQRRQTQKATPFKKRATQPLFLEALEDRVVPDASWDNFNGNPQHTGISTVAAQPMDQILWQTSLDQQGTYFWHTGEPVFTPNDTVILPVITSAGNTFDVEAFNGATGQLLWSISSGYIQPSYSWLPPYQPVYDSVTDRVYFAGPGGTLYYINHPDDPGSSTPTLNEVAFYGTSNYTADESAYNSSIYIDTPLTVDDSGNVFFGFEETGTNPSGITDGGIGRVSAAGSGTYVTTGAAVGTGSGSPALGSAPALSNDESVLYVAVNDSNNPYLVGVNAATLAPMYSVELSVPNSGTAVELINVSTAAPMVAPDGTVFMGVFADNYDGSRGYMTHYSADLGTEYAPGAFGWDDTASIIPTSMVPSYTGTSSYLVLTKYNNYVAAETGSSGGNGVNEIAVLDPYATQPDPNNDNNPNLPVMKQVMTITSPTEDSQYVNSGYPDATREWCTNGTAVDPATDSVFINNEDGYSYRWNLGSDTITQAVEITNGYGEPYTPTTIAPNGEIYAINGGSLFALGGFSNFTLTNVSSDPSAVAGQSVTFTTTLASTTGGGAVPTGNVTYTYTSGTNDPLNSTPVVLGTVPVLNGKATLTTAALLPDHYHIVATYSGDPTDGYAGGSTTLEQVILATPSNTVTSSAPAVTAGQSVTLTATISPNGVSFVPLGTVTFMDGATVLGTVRLNSLDQSTASSSPQTVTFTTSSLPVGSDSITAVYSGDLNFTGTTSPVITETINPVPTITTSLPDWTINRPYNQTVEVAGGTDPITFSLTSGSLPTGLTLNPTTGAITGQPTTTSGSPFHFTITATDADGVTANRAYTVAINTPPSIATPTLPNWTAGFAYSQTIATSNGTGPFTFAVTSGSLPTGLSLAPGSGAITGTPTTTTGSPFTFTITATDLSGASAAQPYSVTINPAITVAPTSLPAAMAGSAYTQTLAVSGGTTPYATISVTTFNGGTTGLTPSSIAVNAGAATVTVAGTPAAGGVVTFTVTVTDSVGATDVQDYTLAVDQPPAFTSANATAFTVGTNGSFSMTASGYPAPAFTEYGTLPTGVTLDSDGLLSGTPAAGTGGTYPVVITATNGIVPDAVETFTLTVNQPPAFTSSNSATFTVGFDGSFSTTASGYPAPTFTESGPLPTGVTLSSAGVLSGTPAAGTGGAYPITMTAANGVAPDKTQSFTLTVDQAPAISGANNTTFTVGSNGSFPVTASGYPAPTFSETGALPTGVTLTSAGVLTGTPVAGTGGVYPIVIEANNGVSSEATLAFTLTVDQVPAFTSSNSGTFTVGVPGSFQVTATGYPAPTFSESGPLPTGVTLSSSGTLSGTPAAGTAGTYPIVITAGNGATPAQTQSFTLTVGQPPSLSNSFVTVSNPSVASGTTSTLILQAVDTFGNDLTLGGLTVAFGLGGGSGQGTIGPVTYVGNGMYTATFAATVAGTNTVTASINGAPVTSAAPGVTVTPGSIDVTHSQLSTVLSSVQLGGQTTVVLRGEDANGNLETSGGVSNIAFKLENSTGGQGTIGSVTDNGNGTYSATFLGTADGSNIIEATIGGTPVTSTAPITVTGAAVNLADSLVATSATALRSGANILVSLQAEYGKGLKETSGGLIVAFSLASSSGGQGTFGPVSYVGNGTYQATFTGTIAGSNSVTATINGSRVTSKAPSISVTPGALSYSTSLVALSAPVVKAGAKVTVTFQPRDAAGNKLTLSGQAVSFSLGSGGTATGVFSTAVYANGVYTATFTGNTAGGSTVTALVNNQKITSTPPVVTVTPGAASPAESTLSVQGGFTQVVAGGSISLTLRALDAYGNPEPTGGLQVAFKLANTTGGSGTFSVDTDNGNGTYTVTFTATKAGANTIEATIAGAKVAPTVAVTVTPGPVSLAKSAVTVAKPGSVAPGKTINVFLVAMDAFGNVVTTNLLQGGTVSFELGSTTSGQGTFTSATYLGAGEYEATFTGTGAGTNTVEALIDGSDVTSKLPTIKVT